MPEVNRKQLATRLSQQLASFKLPAAAINSIADKVLVEGLSIGRFNPCIYGICIDYFTDKMPQLERLSPKQNIAKWEVFPYGIIEWDRFHVRIAYSVPELEGKGLTRGFEG
jgi:hypothetical protein